MDVSPYCAFFVEIVLDTGQRYQSVDLSLEQAIAAARDMRLRLRVVAVTMVDARTGEAITRPSHNLVAGGRWIDHSRDFERERLAEALGDA